MFIVVSMNEVVLEQEHRQTMESIQAASSHTVMSKEGWLQTHSTSGLLQEAMRVPPANKTKTKLQQQH